MLDRPPFFLQETEDSCVPACLRMLLAYHEIQKSEEELIRACRCMPREGADPSDLVSAARGFGFTGTWVDHLDWDNLRDAVGQRLYPIV